MNRSNEPLVAAFADALRQARQTAGMTPEDLAERADVSVRFISALETGKRQPSPSALAAVSVGLGLAMSAMIMLIERRIGEEMQRPGDADGDRQPVLRCLAAFRATPDPHGDRAITEARQRTAIGNCPKPLQ